MRRETVAALVVLVALVASVAAQQTRAVSSAAEYAPSGVVLLPTNHPVLSRDLSQLWLVPPDARSGAAPSTSELTAAMKLRAKGDDAKALPVLTRASRQEGALGLYATYEMGMALLNLGRADQARKAFRSIGARRPIGYLRDAAAIGEGQSAEAMNDAPAAVAIYEGLLASRPAGLDELLFRLGTAARISGQLDRAVSAFMRLYYEFPLSEFSPKAQVELSSLPNVPAISPGSDRYRLELARAERQFVAREYAPARSAFTALAASARGDDRELVDLRVAEANYFLKQPRAARVGLRPYLTKASRQAEVLYFHALALRDLGATSDYFRVLDRVVDEFPDQIWAQEALNNLATHYLVRDDDEKADTVLRELYGKYPRSIYAERAAWKVGWRAFLKERYAETATLFERAASDFQRSDYRPSWLYWAGRAHELSSARDIAADRFALVAADYLNSYYGRLAVKRLGGRLPAPRVVSDRASTSGDAPSPSPSPEQATLIRALVAAGFYDHAVAELRYAQRTTGDSPAIQATLAWVSREQGLGETGQARFMLLRGAITMMRRAYPQFMAAGGEQLPREILTTIFPLAYWDLIRTHAAANRLDPYLVAALVAQESTFSPDVRSSANAVGLMQLLPSTARQQARKLNLTYSARLLTDPEANIRMGTLYFGEKLKEFGATHLALAAYNAGETPVRRWVAERPTLGLEEFVDDIPYAETQNYVKRIVGTAQDYRQLYGQ
ncbi:MAG: tetratricopeptide repeat protein [Acidobacteria bacterium]|nr:tetratricopeptide repeat protein [Acidobacteriota bacterium]